MLVALGSMFIVFGVVVAAMTTLRRGKLSQPERAPDSPRDTLEPSGRGRRLSLRADLPGLSLIAIGAILLLIAAAKGTAG